MKVVKDSMVLINLAKITLLETSCNFFKVVLIPKMVFEEVVTAGKNKGSDEVIIIENLIKNKKIKVKEIKDKEVTKMVNEFNIYGGEAEALILYKQEKCDLLISDDFNLRKKKDLVNARIIGSLAVLLKLRQSKKIDKNKFENCINKMREIGWFSSSVIDKVLLDGEKYG
ncbi:MAG: hypothetical protein AABX19_02170 [Nanoarchaeota archaeon]